MDIPHNTMHGQCKNEQQMQRYSGDYDDDDNDDEEEEVVVVITINV